MPLKTYLSAYLSTKYYMHGLPFFTLLWNIIYLSYTLTTQLQAWNT